MAILMKAGDTAPVVHATLLDADGEAVDLDGSTVRFIMSSQATPHVVVVDTAATLAQVGDGLDGTKGTVEYAWAPGDTADPGAYVCEFEVTFADGAVQTFPTQDYIPATIVDDLGGTV